MAKTPPKLRKRVNLSSWARANDIGKRTSYAWAHSQKYKGIIEKIGNNWKVDIELMEEVHAYEMRYGEISMSTSALKIIRPEEYRKLFGINQCKRIG